MKKLILLIAAAVLSFSAAAQDETTVIISKFTTRAVQVEMPLFYQMATSEASGYALVQADTSDRMTGFMTIVSAFDPVEDADCIKIRLADGKNMTIMSFFNGWAEELADEFTEAGYEVSEDDNTVTFRKGENKLTLKKEDFAKAKISIKKNNGWLAF